MRRSLNMEGVLISTEQFRMPKLEQLQIIDWHFLFERTFTRFSRTKHSRRDGSRIRI